MTNSEDNKFPPITNAVALKLYQHIANEWGISAEQSRTIFSFLEDKQFEDWMSGNLNSVQPDLLVFVSHLMAIYKLLHQIFPDPVQANAWMSKPSNEFKYLNRLELITQKGIKGAQEIKNHLESQFN